MQHEKLQCALNAAAAVVPQIHLSGKRFRWLPFWQKSFGFNIVPVDVLEPLVPPYDVATEQIRFARLEALTLIGAKATKDEVFGDGVH